MKRMVSIALVCFLLCGCTKMNDDVSTYVDNSSIIESTSTNISDLSDITSNEDLTNSDTFVSENIITSSNVSSKQENVFPLLLSKTSISKPKSFISS